MIATGRTDDPPAPRGYVSLGASCSVALRRRLFGSVKFGSGGGSVADLNQDQQPPDEEVSPS